MKRLQLLSITLMLALTMSAQGNRQPEKFSPEKFDADLQEFITNEAKLTPQEAAKFFPVYKEMQSKMRALFEKQRNLGRSLPNTNDEAACLKAIRERDDTDLEMKRIQKTYHEKFLKQMPASKVYAIIQAEDNFHRRMIKNWGSGRAQQWRPQQFQQGQRQWPHHQHQQKPNNK